MPSKFRFLVVFPRFALYNNCCQTLTIKLSSLYISISAGKRNATPVHWRTLLHWFNSILIKDYLLMMNASWVVKFATKGFISVCTDGL